MIETLIGESMSAIPSGHHRHGSATEDPSGARLSPSGYVVLEKMRWRTPEWLVKSIAKDLGIDQFDLDAAGEHEAKCALQVLTMEDDCLVAEWNEVPNLLGTTIQNVFFNPPWGAKGLVKAARVAFPEQKLAAFPGTAAFVKRAHQQSQSHGLTVALLIGVTMDAWQRPLAALADEVWFGPRIRFEDVHGNPGPQPPGPHMVLIFRGNVPENGWPGGPRVRWDWSPL